MDGPRYVGASTFLRVWPPGMLVLAFLLLTQAGTNGTSFALLFSLSAVVVARLLPWRFEVFDEGIDLTFAFGRHHFLDKHETTISVNLGGAVARRRAASRFGYPLTDGLVEPRRLALRALLLQQGFQVV